MFESTAIYTTSSVLALLFEVVYLLIGIAALALSGIAARGRRGLVATGGVLLLLGALGDVLLFAADLLGQGMFGIHLTPVVHSVCTFAFIGGLLALVLAATKRPASGTAGAPAPTHPAPTSSPNR